MLEEALTHYIGVPSEEITRLRQLHREAIYEDPEYVQWVNNLDQVLLQRTLLDSRNMYELHLPRFAEMLKTQYNLSNTAMSPYTLGNWLIGFLQYPQSIKNLTQFHQRIPVDAIRVMLPDMIAMLDGMGEGQAEWQRALALLALPLTV